MATVEAQEGGPQPIETLPDASNMTPSNAAAESSAPGSRDEEDDDGAGGTQRNDADGEPKRREQPDVRSWTSNSKNCRMRRRNSAKSRCVTGQWSHSVRCLGL